MATGRTVLPDASGAGAQSGPYASFDEILVRTVVVAFHLDEQPEASRQRAWWPQGRRAWRTPSPNPFRFSCFSEANRQGRSSSTLIWQQPLTSTLDTS